jgi:hypothetical protein
LPRRRSGPRAGRKYPRRALWIERRNAAFARAGTVCEVSGVQIAFQKAPTTVKSSLGFYHTPDEPIRWRRAADHIWPERFCRRFCKGCDPHVLENLVVITPSLHAQKTAVEWRIFRGDRIGYGQELVRLGFDQALLDRAMKAILASVKEK